MNISRRNLLLLFAGTFAANAVHAKKAFADGAGVSGFEHLETLSSEGVSQLPDDIAGIRDQADSLGLSDVDFDNLYLGDGIPTYVYSLGSFNKGPLYFPVLENQRIVFWIMETEDGIQATNGLVPETMDFASPESEIAIVYDQTAAYLYSRQEAAYTELLKYPAMPDRGIIDTACVPEIDTATYGQGDKLPAWPSIRAYNAYVSVPIVRQPAGSNMCWAATCASIANSRTGSSYTCEGVAKFWYGAIDYDKGLPRGDSAKVLKALGVAYTYYGGVPSAGTINNNLSSGFAIYGSWSYESGNGHATVIRGVNSNEALSLMDPLTSSFTTANRSGGTWRARSAGTGANMGLDATTMRYT